MKDICDFCGGKLIFPCYIRRFRPTSPFHLNPGGLCRYCSKGCYDASIGKMVDEKNLYDLVIKKEVDRFEYKEILFRQF